MLNKLGRKTSSINIIIHTINDLGVIELYRRHGYNIMYTCIQCVTVYMGRVPKKDRAKKAKHCWGELRDMFEFHIYSTLPTDTQHSPTYHDSATINDYIYSSLVMIATIIV